MHGWTSTGRQDIRRLLQPLRLEQHRDAPAQLDHAVPSQLLQRAVDVHHAEAQQIGQRVLAQRPRKGVVLRKPDHREPLPDLQQQVRRPLVGRLPAEPRDLVEQQRLAVARALLLNPVLLVMDEPTEGLAPVIVDHLVQVFRHLAQEGIAMLLVEQNLGVATAVADSIVIMVNGRIALKTDARELEGNADLQRRYLGAGMMAGAEG